MCIRDRARALAVSLAMVSALVLRILPFPSWVNGAITGVKMCIRDRVYAVKVRLENTVVWKRGMMNVGNRPTFNGKQITLELSLIHI